MFMDDDRTDLNIQDSDGNTPLILLCKKNIMIFKKSKRKGREHLFLIRDMLLTEKVDINIKNKRGMTAFDEAVRHYNKDILKVLFMVDNFENVKMNLCFNENIRKFIEEYPKSDENIENRRKFALAVKHKKMVLAGDVYTLIRIFEFDYCKK